MDATVLEQWREVAELLERLYETTGRLESIFRGRKFTPDGHLVGSIGEVIAAYMFDLKLAPASIKAHDAIAHNGRRVEIKLTQGRSIGIREKPEHLIVLRRPPGGPVAVVYNGPGALAWEAAGKMQRNGQCMLNLTRLATLDQGVAAEDRLPMVREAPV